MLEGKKPRAELSLLLFPLLLGMLSITQLVNITHLDGLKDDFSNLLMQVTTANGTFSAPYDIVDKSDGEWVLVNVTVPEGNYAMGALLSSDAIPPEPDQDPKIFNIPFFPGLAMDFSNLRIQLVDSGKNVSEVNYSIIAKEEGLWAIIGLEREPKASETISVLADVEPSSGLPQMNETPAVEPIPENISIGDNATQGNAPPDNPVNETVPIAPVGENASNDSGIYLPIEDYAAQTNLSVGNQSQAGNETIAISVDIEDYMNMTNGGNNPPPASSVPYGELGEIRDANNALVDADISFTLQSAQALKKGQWTVEGAASGGLAPGRYQVSIRPRNHPIESLTLENVDIGQGTGRLLDLDHPSPDTVNSPPGTRFQEVYVVNPHEGVSGSFTARAKSSQVYKCADWDFGNRVCLGEWVNVLNVTPGEYYTMNFDSADPAYGEGSTYFTLKSITIDGNLDDWAAVLSNPNNVMRDGMGGIDDLDTPSTPNRDLTLYAFTWDSNYMYSYFRRTTSGSNVVSMLIYIDVDNNGRLNASDYVIRYQWQNSRQWDSTRFNYVPVNTTAGDAITGDGTPEPGSVSNSLNLESNILGGDTTNIFLETRLNWSAIGLAPGSPLNYHVSAAQGAGTNLPTQVEDNMNKTNTSIIDLSIAPARSGAGNNGDTVRYNHTITNLGNMNDTINVYTAGTTPGFTVNLTYANGTVLSDTNGDSVPDVGIIAPGASVNITAAITVAGASNGAVDQTYVVAKSSRNPLITNDVLDTTYVGQVVIFPSRSGNIVSNATITYNHTVMNNLAGSHVIDINATSNSSYTVNVTYLNGTALTDADGDGLIDIGNTTQGTQTIILVKIQIPAGATIGTVDKTTVLALQATDKSVNSTSTDTSTVSKALVIVPNREGFIPVAGGYYIFYSHTVYNNREVNVTAELSNRSSLNFTVQYFAADMITPLNDTDADGKPDTGPLPPFGGSREILVKITVPAGTPAVANTTDHTNITVNSSVTPSQSDFVTDNSTARVLVTYEDAARATFSNLFNNTQTVYANSYGLTGYTNVFYRWYDSNGTLVRQSGVIPVDAAKQAPDSLSLNTSLPAGIYSVYLHNNAGSAEITHEFFTVQGVPNVTVVAPNGGEVWNGTKTILYNLTDKSGKNVTVDISWTTNGGISWTNITTLQLNTTNCTGNPALQCVEGQFNYSWDTTTVMNNSNYLIKVSVNNTYFDGADQSNAIFTISNTYDIIAPVPAALSPQNYSLDPDGAVSFSCNASDNIGLANISLYLNGALNQTANASGTLNQSFFNVTGLPDGNYTWFCHAADSMGNSNSSVPWMLDVNRSAVPIATNFTNKTNWTSLPNLRSVCNGTAYVDVPTNGSVRWFHCVDVSSQNFDLNVRISNNLSTVLFGLGSSFNTTAEVVLRNLSWDYMPMVLIDGQECPSSICQNISYNVSTGIILFNVTHFTNYSTTGASQLTIWDQNDTNMSGGNRSACVGKQIKFYANYSKKTDNNPILGANCTINFTDTTNNPMAYNATSTFYEYNRTFASTGLKTYNVTCRGLQTITLSDSVNITQCGCPIINTTGVYNQTENYRGAPNNATPLSGFACVEITSSNVVFDCKGYNITGESNATTYGVLLNGSLSNVTIRNCPAISNYTDGVYIFNSTSAQLTNLTASNNTYGIYIANSSTANITGVNSTNNSNNGIYLDSTSTLANLSNNRFCSNGIDVQNAGSSNSGRLDRCDSFINWSENGHFGCEYSCSDLWHRFFGNANGNIVLGNNTTYVYTWNASAFNIYFTDSDSVINWTALQAIGRTTANATSSNDFTELDTAFNTTGFPDNINKTYSSDGTNPLDTRNYTIYGRDINLIPVANSTHFTTLFRTGILWDTSDGGVEYGGSQSTAWIVRINASTADTYGTYDFLSQIPYTLATREGAGNTIAIYLELK
jgi:hypothetical protein